MGDAVGVNRRIRVEQGASASARWEMVDTAPVTALDGLVEGYTGFDETAARPVTRREVVTPRVVLIVNLGEPIGVARGAGTEATMRSFVAGLSQEATLTRHDGTQRGIEVRLTPLGAHRLFGVSMDSLAGEVVAVEELWGRAGTELVERLAASPDWTRRFDLLDDALARTADRGPEPRPEVAAAWHRLRSRHGDLAIGDLVVETGWSRRLLAARFREQIGLTPKAAARVLRFDRATLLLTGPSRPSLAAVATTSGYFDQAHFHRDFQRFAGCTPTEYLAARLVDLPGTGVDRPVPAA